MIGDDGSTATTATERPACAQLGDERRHERRLAGARRPGDADEMRGARRAGRGARSAASATGVWFSTAVSSRASARRSPARAASARRDAVGLGGRGGRARPAVPVTPRARPRSPGGSRRPRGSSSRARTRPTRPRPRSGSMSSSGMIPPTVTRTSSRPALAHERAVTLGTSVMCAPDRIDRPTTSTSSWSAAVTIISGVWRRPGVDDLEALVAEPAGEHLRAAIVAVEAGLGDQHLERSLGHGRDCTGAPWPRSRSAPVLVVVAVACCPRPRRPPTSSSVRQLLVAAACEISSRSVCEARRRGRPAAGRATDRRPTPSRPRYDLVHRALAFRPLDPGPWLVGDGRCAASRAELRHAAQHLAPRPATATGSSSRRLGNTLARRSLQFLPARVDRAQQRSRSSARLVDRRSSRSVGDRRLSAGRRRARGGRRTRRGSCRCGGTGRAPTAVVIIVPGLAHAAHHRAQVGRLDDDADALGLRAAP